MDSKQFDELVARLASGQSRREALLGIAGGALAAVGISSVASSKGKKKGRVGAQGKKGNKGRAGAQGNRGNKGRAEAQGRKANKGRVGAQGKRNRVKVEHCLSIGERCDPPRRIREGAKNKKKTHTCEGVINKKGKNVRGCCTRYSVQDGNVRRCACLPEGEPCTTDTERNCCSQFCSGGVCAVYGS